MKLVDSAVVAVLAILVSRLLVPVQLDYLRGTAFALAAVGMVLAWAMHVSERRRLILVCAISLCSLIGLLWIDNNYVDGVAMDETQKERQYLTGSRLSSFGESVSVASGKRSGELIEETGVAAIPQLWRDHYFMKNLFLAAFLVFTLSGSMALTGAAGILEKSRKPS